MSGRWESKRPPCVGMEGRIERQRWVSALAFTEDTSQGNSSWHVRRRRFLRWHCHGHFIGGKDVLRWGLKSRIDGNLWSVPVVYVLIAVPNTVDQVGLKDNENGKEDEHKQQETAGVQREQVVFIWEVRQLVQVVLDSGQVREGADGHQAAQRKVKQLIAKERDEPAITISNGPIHHHGTNGEHKERDGKTHTSIL